MRILKISLFLTLGIGSFQSCKKDSNSTQMADDDDDTCVQRPTSTNGTLIDGKYIIAYNSNSGIARGTDQQRVEDLSLVTLSRNNISELSLEQSFSGEPRGFVARLTTEEVARLKLDANIAMIEQDRIISLGTCFTVVAPRLVTWNVSRVGYGDGTGKTAWIIDSGIDFTHPDLTVDSSRSRSFITGVPSPRDENGHGTHVAGIIGGKNNTIGVLGVASGAKLVALRVLDKDGAGTLSGIIQALAYVNSTGKPGDVVNMSVGDDEGTSDILDQQVKSTAGKGIYVTIAAGNEHTQADQYSPARANGMNIYTVSAVDSLDNFASFSNYGNNAVDYAMPGVRILSTYLAGRYAYASGTSMAAPHLAGLLLLKGSNFTISGTAKNDPDGTPDPIAHF